MSYNVLLHDSTRQTRTQPSQQINEASRHANLRGNLAWLIYRSNHILLGLMNVRWASGHEVDVRASLQKTQTRARMAKRKSVSLGRLQKFV
jgi:hypothetical protein